MLKIVAQVIIRVLDRLPSQHRSIVLVIFLLLAFSQGGRWPTQTVATLLG